MSSHIQTQHHHHHHLWSSYRPFVSPEETSISSSTAKPRPSTTRSAVPSPSSQHVCGVGASSLPQGWEWGAGGRARQTPGEWCRGCVEPWHRAELPGGPGHLSTLWPQEDHPLRWGQDVRYAHLYCLLSVWRTWRWSRVCVPGLRINLPKLSSRSCKFS